MYPHIVQTLLLGILAWTLASEAAEPQPHQKSGTPGPLPTTKASVAEKFKKLEAADDAALAEVDQWKQENNNARANGAGISQEQLEKRIQARLEPIRKSYQEFLSQHPDHAQAHLAYGCFLNERQDETGARSEWEKALELDPQNAAIYNNLAGSYSVQWNIQMAGALMAAIPTLLVYVLLGRFFLRGLLAGSLKG